MSFDDHFHRDADPQSQPQDLTVARSVESIAPGITDFLASHGGSSYENGLYRIFFVADIERWNSIVSDALPELEGRAFCFGYDWMGRIFAVHLRETENQQYHVVLLEPGTGEILEIPATFMEFHDREMIEFPDDVLAKSFFEDWIAAGGETPNFQECVGYVAPLFLGGEDDSTNLEIIDMEVYWVTSGQLLNQTRDLPDGTPIGNVDIED